MLLARMPAVTASVPTRARGRFIAKPLLVELCVVLRPGSRLTYVGDRRLDHSLFQHAWRARAGTLWRPRARAGRRFERVVEEVLGAPKVARAADGLLTRLFARCYFKDDTARSHICSSPPARRPDRACRLALDAAS